MKVAHTYKSADFFMARYANLPFKSLEILDLESIEELIRFYQNNPFFQEAIATASFDLHQVLKKWERIPDKIPFYLSLSKYLIRMSSRATPFGLFSSVGWGKFGEKTEMPFDVEFLKKKVSLGSECVRELIEVIHKDIEAVRRLRVRLNTQLIYRNDRVFLNNDHPSFQEDYTSIKITSAYEEVRRLAQTPIEYLELEEQMVSCFSVGQKEKVQNYLWELFQRNYLTSQLVNPSILSSFPEAFHDILERVGHLDEVKKLEVILRDIQEYESSRLGEKIELLEKITHELKVWKKEIKNPLRVDHYYDSKQIILHNNVQRAVEKAIHVLTRVSFTQEKPNVLTIFYRFFLEKYGTERLVPFSEIAQTQRVFDLVTGKEGAEEQREINPLEHFLALHSQHEQINIAPYVDSLPPLTLQEQQTLPPSQELFFEIEAKDYEEIEQNRFTLLIRGLSHQAGGMFGRFLNFWDKEKTNEISNFVKEEEKLFPHLIILEPSFVPDKSKVGNISVGIQLRPIQLPMHYQEEKANVVSLDDIYVGADHHKIYLFSKKLNKEIIITPNVMTNPIYMPFPLRVLLFLSQYQMNRFTRSSWSSLKKGVYSPRIVYENIVLAPAEWRFSYPLLYIDQAITKEKLSLVVKDAFKKYRVPSTVLLVQGDNHLQLHWNRELHFDVILKEFIKTKEITLQEQRDKKENLFVSAGAGERHVCEFVVPVVKDPSIVANETKKFYPRTDQFPVSERFFFPGGDWWYAKIFLSSNDADLFLSRFLLPHMEYVMKQFHNPRWFYIRYNEGGFHIRLRICADTEQIKQEMIPELNRWLASLTGKGEIEDFSICSYKPEIERYGGPECIKLAEDVFCADSGSILKILARKDSSLPLHLIASMGIINILHRFFPDTKNILTTMASSKDQAHLLDGIRPFSKIGMKFTKAILVNDESDTQDPLLQFLKKCYSHTHATFDLLAKTIAKVESSGEAWNPLPQIVDSLIHMHCNRLLGTSSQLEQKARVAALYFLEKMTFQPHGVMA